MISSAFSSSTKPHFQLTSFFPLGWQSVKLHLCWTSFPWLKVNMQYSIKEAAVSNPSLSHSKMKEPKTKTYLRKMTGEEEPRLWPFWMAILMVEVGKRREKTWVERETRKKKGNYVMEEETEKIMKNGKTSVCITLLILCHNRRGRTLI